MAEYAVLYSGSGSDRINAQTVEETGGAIYFFEGNSPENTNNYISESIAMFRKEDILGFIKHDD